LPESSPNRDLRLDFFRGVALFLIFIDHIPENILSYFTLQGVTFFDAAEVFIFISGFTAALVYGRRLAAKGAVYMTAQVWRRAWQLYVAHIILFVLYIAEVSYTVMTFKNPMYNEEMRVGEFLDEPHVAIVKALLLQFQPTFLDILPLYIVMLLIFPGVLLGLARRPAWVLVSSALVYAWVQLSGMSVPAYPEGHVWYFNPLAWQFLFVVGAALGLHYAQGGRFPDRLLRIAFPAAAAIFVLTLAVKITWTIHGAWDSFPGLLLRQLWPINKNNLSPWRLIPFLAVVVLVAELVPVDARFLASRAARPVLACGRQSLEIFCLSILLSALGHFAISEYNFGLAMQLSVNAIGIAAMCLTARLIDWYKTMDRIPMLQPALAGRRRDDNAAE
jgi:hypothetical protein